MDEMTQRRKARLRQLLEGEPFNGSREQFLKAAGVSKGRVSQMLDPSAPFGERSAMNLAKRLSRKVPELKDERWFEREGGSVTNITSPKGSPEKRGVTADIQWTSKQEIPNAMPYAPEHLKSAVMLIGSLLGALDERSRKTIGSVLNDLAQSPDEASYFADIAVSAAKTQRPFTDNVELERALHPTRKPVHND